MFHYQEGPLIGTNVQSVRPVSSLSSGSGDSGIYTMPPLPTARPPSVSPSGPSSPAIQLFSFALGFDNIAQELAKALELW
uniref:Nucleoporin NUP53 n=1 Tax=Heterorhabditis bacteriophora TaxID=37862 RepID=A0A1I7XDW6_HETBA